MTHIDVIITYIQSAFFCKIKEKGRGKVILADFALLLDHPKSFVRNRALHILAVDIQWDEENHFDSIISDYLTHETDDKLITTRQCIKELA